MRGLGRLGNLGNLGNLEELGNLGGFIGYVFFFVPYGANVERVLSGDGDRETRGSRRTRKP